MVGILFDDGELVTSRPRILYLLRHAKSSWSDETLDDHDRPLAERGKVAVERLRRHLTGAGIAPDLVLCSSARRTVMTLDGIKAALPADTQTQIEAGLYGAPSGRLLNRLHEVSDDVADVMLIGHNPGIEDLATALIGSGDAEPRRRLADKFPTGALATLSFNSPWSGLAPSAARLESFVVPREL
jgi:phosphohistidine phosphatase